MKHLASALISVSCAFSLSAQAYSTAPAGAGCGPVLDVSFAPVGNAGNHTVTVAASNMTPNGYGIMVWGTMPLNVPLFGCTAYTDFAWGHNINPDQNGDWSWSRSWPASAIASFRIQIASLDVDAMGQLQVQLSNCVVASHE